MRRAVESGWTSPLPEGFGARVPESGKLPWAKATRRFAMSKTGDFWAGAESGQRHVSAARKVWRWSVRVFGWSMGMRVWLSSIQTGGCSGSVWLVVRRGRVA